MESNPKKSKALIITIIILILLLIVGYLIFKNAGKSSSNNFVSRIFSSLSPSSNTKKETVQAGEDINKGDSVSKAGMTDDGKIVVVKARNGSAVLGIANENIGNGNFGEIIIESGGINNFLNSFADFINGLYTGNTGNITITPGTGGDIIPVTITKECSDEVDNDGDGKIDIDDPECHLDGNLENEYLPDHNSEAEAEIGGETNETGIDLITKSLSVINPTQATPIYISATIRNEGNTSTGKEFQSLILIKKPNVSIEEESTSKNILSFLGIKKLTNKVKNLIGVNKINAENVVEIAINTPEIKGHTGYVISTYYTFEQIGTYSVMACADKKTQNDTGTIEELNENNNCTDWYDVSITNSLPPPEPPYTQTECEDQIDNDADGGIDEQDPNCHLNGDINDTYMPSYPSEKYNDQPEPNKCLSIEQNPLTFTDEEKAQLEALLRRFYLVAPTLKSEADIENTYAEISRYEENIKSTQRLIDQCYSEVNSSTWWSHFYRRGNPWYSKETGGRYAYSAPADDNGSIGHAYTNYNLIGATVGQSNSGWDATGSLACAPVSGYYYGEGVKIRGYYNVSNLYVKTEQAVDCFTEYNKQPWLKNPIKCYGVGNNNDVFDDGTNHSDIPLSVAGCKWKDGVDLLQVELLLNIW